ncbi:aliphatic sulfonate ABC transporter substrate-binding protein [Caballeronia sp. LZ035]|uniref:aliphatic sulfonate ABC transporter substrate-binding protein n=1 Tax=Caballeronia sp. LZ035 TaxID=3038568 RepID=UPI00286701BF|nr:aliphatic sulfonate ABC transporter substrate-binding protein [Caballeronia sp. LZ035]MDR5759702.1 aliphatic sulfonate ABC transporter substrate-binding protein [Caballeronia sp. LZ035]
MTSRHDRPASFNRRKLMAGGLAAAAGFMIGGPARAATVLRVGDMNSIGWKAFLEASGEAKNLPYEIEWSKFPAGQQELQAFNADALDVGQTGDVVFLFAYAAGCPARAVSAITFAPSFIPLLAQRDSGIKRVADLKGRKLAVNAGGGPELMTYGLLEKAGLKRSDVNIVFLDPTAAKPAFASGAVDAWLTWAPYSTLAIQQNGAYPIANLSDVPNLFSGNNFLLVHEKAARDKRDAIRDFLARSERAQRWALANVDAAAAALVKDTKLDPATARSLLADFKPTPAPLNADVRRALQQSADGFYRYGMIKQSIGNISAAFDGQLATTA